jgi:hypothetical protein
MRFLAEDNRMAKSKAVRARIKTGLKQEAEPVLRFPARMPSAGTRKVLNAARRGEDVETFASVAVWKRRVRAL